MTAASLDRRTAQWPRDGVPDNPRGWLIHVALRRLTDHVRSEIARRNREAAAAEDFPVIAAPAVYAEPGIDPDDTLVLLFTCCHPSLSPASAIALTLRAVGGGDRQLVPGSRSHDGAADQPREAEYRGVAGAVRHARRRERAQRLSSVLHVLYLDR